MSRAEVLAVCDLDRTLIYSARAAGADCPPLRCVEHYRGAPQSFLTEVAAGLLETLARRCVFVPTTTRTLEQYARVVLPGPPPAYAIVANGGHLLVGGVLDEGWHRGVRDRQRAECAPLAAVRAELLRIADPAWLLRTHVADELFCYALVERRMLPPEVLSRLRQWCAERGWAVSLQGRKLYCVPRGLTKSAAAAEVGRRVGARRVLAAGDSLLDADLLEYADLAIRPAHGELFDVGWTRPGLRTTTATGVRAGEEIVGLLLQEVAQCWPARA